jgi:NAD(P)H-hydrate epimerase
MKLDKSSYFSLSKKDISKFIPKRKSDANKGDFGHVLIIGGDYGFAGAVIMAAEAACRTGAGRVTVLSRKEHLAPLLSRMPNVMTANFENKNDWQKIIKNKTAIVIGPGLGNSEWSAILFGLAMESNLAKIIDADALHFLSKSDQKEFNLTNSVITPHPKEASILLASTVDEIQKDRKLSIKKLQEKYQTNVVLKGQNSLILGKEEKLFLCPYGNPGMAVAGMGDILSGIIAGLIAQNIESFSAANLGVLIHALAGDKVAKQKGQIGIIPGDLINIIPQIINL